jgi:hypothetical protein
MSPLPPETPVNGIGIYALYYRGDFPTYQPLVAAREPVPIYGGKSVPKGTRAPGVRTAERARVGERLRLHARSIESAANLRRDDFRCRYLVLAKEVYVFLAESLLIRRHRPIWNGTGFGNKAVGGGRTGQKLSAWDTVHPGRGGTGERRGRFTSDEIMRRWEARFRAQPPGS